MFFSFRSGIDLKQQNNIFSVNRQFLLVRGTGGPPELNFFFVYIFSILYLILVFCIYLFNSNY